MNTGSSPTSSIDSPLRGTSRHTYISNKTNNDSDSKSDNNVGEKLRIGKRVLVLRESAIHFGTIIYTHMMIGLSNR